MKNNRFFKIMTAALAGMMTFAFVACDFTPNANNGDPQQPPVTSTADANVKFAYAEDKIYQSYNREVNGVQDYILAKQGEEYMAKLIWLKLKN